MQRSIKVLNVTIVCALAAFVSWRTVATGVPKENRNDLLEFQTTDDGKLAAIEGHGVLPKPASAEDMTEGRQNGSGHAVATKTGLFRDKQGQVNKDDGVANGGPEPVVDKRGSLSYKLLKYGGLGKRGEKKLRFGGLGKRDCQRATTNCTTATENTTEQHLPKRTDGKGSIEAGYEFFDPTYLDDQPI